MVCYACISRRPLPIGAAMDVGAATSVKTPCGAALILIPVIGACAQVAIQTRRCFWFFLGSFFGLDGIDRFQLSHVDNAGFGHRLRV